MTMIPSVYHLNEAIDRKMTMIFFYVIFWARDQNMGQQGTVATSANCGSASLQKCQKWKIPPHFSPKTKRRVPKKRWMFQPKCWKTSKRSMSIHFPGSTWHLTFHPSSQPLQVGSGFVPGVAWIRPLPGPESSWIFQWSCCPPPREVLRLGGRWLGKPGELTTTVGK